MFCLCEFLYIFFFVSEKTATRSYIPLLLLHRINHSRPSSVHYVWLSFDLFYFFIDFFCCCYCFMFFLILSFAQFHIVVVVATSLLLLYFLAMILFSVCKTNTLDGYWLLVSHRCYSSANTWFWRRIYV